MDKFHQLPKVIQDMHKTIEWFIPQVEKLPRSRQWQRTPLLGFLFLLLCSWNAPTYAAGDVSVTLSPKPCTNTLNTLPEMQLIPAGVFQMGSPDSDSESFNDEKPLHEVSIYRAFALSRCEITVGQFKRFIAETGYVTDVEKEDGCYTLNKDNLEFERVSEANWRNPGMPQSNDHPVVCISWNDAKAYSRWLSVVTGGVYRLPTEAEWEYAARARDNSLQSPSRYWGNASDTTCQYANGADQTLQKAFPRWSHSLQACEDQAVYTQAAGVYKRNSLGLSDMMGNALEWVEDCYSDDYQSSPRDGAAWKDEACERHVMRGGAWNSGIVSIRSANRSWFIPDSTAFSVSGFRVARALSSFQ